MCTWSPSGCCCVRSRPTTSSSSSRSTPTPASSGTSTTTHRSIATTSPRSLDWWCGYPERSPGYGFWAAIERTTGEFVGWFHLRPGSDDAPDEPELGYRLHRRFWGRGLATEGSRALVDTAFLDRGARRVHASTMAVNAGSRRVMEKSGLRFVRTFHADWPVRITGDEEGDVEYAITRAEWEADRATPTI